MTFAPFTSVPHGLLPAPIAKQVSSWQELVAPSLTIIGTLAGALLLRWVLHRAIDRVVGTR